MSHCIGFATRWYSEVFMCPELRSGISTPNPFYGGIFGQPSGDNTFSENAPKQKFVEGVVFCAANLVNT